MSGGKTGVRTFVIADVRGYSRFTEQHGDELAARLAAKFADLVNASIEELGGELVEVRGDEALAVFTSARQAIRAAVELQAQFEDETEADSTLPLRVGIGVDSGEAVELPDGTFRGAALNVAARLCARARAGEVIVSEATTRLSGRLAGLEYSDRGRVHLKNIPDPIHILEVYSEREPRQGNRWIFMFFGRPARTLGWKLGAAVVLIAAITAGSVVYLTTGDTDPGTASPTTTSGAEEPTTLAEDAGLDALVPSELWRDCSLQTVAEPNAVQTAVCLPDSGVPDRWEISMYPDGGTLAAAYLGELRRREDLVRDEGAALEHLDRRPWQREVDANLAQQDDLGHAHDGASLGGAAGGHRPHPGRGADGKMAFANRRRLLRKTAELRLFNRGASQNDWRTTRTIRMRESDSGRQFLWRRGGGNRLGPP